MTGEAERRRRRRGAARVARAADRPALARADRPDPLPLSFAQQRMWFLARLEGGAAYNVPVAVRLRGDLDREALTAALGDVADRHETLRTVYPETGGVPRQEILTGAAGRPELTVVPVGPGDDLAGLVADEAAREFDVGRDLPWRVRLFVLGAREHVLSLVMHHIAGDAWSFGVLARDLSAAYAARLGGRGPDWDPLPVQYADFALWQRALLDGLLADQLAHWRTALAGLPGELNLPVDRSRPARAGHRGALVPVRIGPPAHARLGEVARRNGVTLFMVLQAGLAVLLSRLGAGTDIPIGVPVAGRENQVLDELVGFFVNTLVLRADLSGDPSFDELLGRVREANLAAYAHQDLPFERLVEELAPERSLARHPLFQVMLAFHYAPPAMWELPGLDVAPVDVAVAGAKVDLSFGALRAATRTGSRLRDPRGKVARSA